MRLHLTPGPGQPDLLDLPWSTPLERWPADRLVALPRGISRHAGRVYAIKEIPRQIAEREYRMLRGLARRDIPVVEAVGVVTDRRDGEEDESLEAALVTRHLQFSLPYRALFCYRLEPQMTSKLLDALVEMLVRLHLAGFYWGDCSLSNTLFRRDAGALEAYLVDAETGELHLGVSDGQRAYDLEIAVENIAGELLDPGIDPVEMALDVRERYESLWNELTREEVFAADERYRIDGRLCRLNQLGYDVGEIQIHADETGERLVLRTQVVEPGHNRRRMEQLAGLSVQENQARRLAADLDCFQAAKYPHGDPPSAAVVARRWLTEAFEPVVRMVPTELRGKLEPAEIYHEVLEHRWYLSERSRRDVDLFEAARDYIDSELVHRPDERAVLTPRSMLRGSESDKMAPTT
ncbi:MAG: DUF4032 domain-containing protein [Streptosporangiales bacterium]|nr:DUF4032 domain-containing protein [Streptosporangiales bacterium]